MSASAGKPSAIFQACLLAINQSRGRIHAGGKVAVLYQGSTRYGEACRQLDIRREKFKERFGIEAPYAEQ